MQDRLDRAAFYRLKAEEARTIAEAMKDSSARDSMMGVASTYDQLADREEERGRFFFDIRENGTLIADSVGHVFPSIDAVVDEAAGAALDIARDRRSRANMQSVVVEARDAQGTPVVTATVSLQIERVTLSPSLPSPSKKCGAQSSSDRLEPEPADRDRCK